MEVVAAFIDGDSWACGGNSNVSIEPIITDLYSVAVVLEAAIGGFNDLSQFSFESGKVA
jgi:hypothetical protein